MMIHQLFSRSFHRPTRFWTLLLVLSLAAAALLAFAGLTRTSAQGTTPEHFVGCAAPSDNSHIIGIPGTAPQFHTAGYFQPAPGDEFAVFRPVGGTCATTAPSLCAAAVKWEGPGSSGGLTVWGDSSITVPIDGMVAGERMCWKVWDASEDKVYTATVVYDASMPFYTTSGLYTPGGISALVSLSPTALKLASFEAASDTAWITRSALLAGSALLLTAGLLFARWRKQRT